jgi:hypothetical protein
VEDFVCDRQPYVSVHMSVTSYTTGSGLYSMRVSDLFLLLNFDDLRQQIHSPPTANSRPLVTTVKHATKLNINVSAVFILYSESSISDDDVALHDTMNSHK